jgi:hypothetical protein
MTDSEEHRVLFRPVSEAQVQEWNIVGDPVMGGVSSGLIRLAEMDKDRAMLFEGQVRSDFGGGFSSIELPIASGTLAGARGVTLDVSGTPAQWRFRAKEPDMRPGEAWQIRFETPADGQTRAKVKIAFRDLTRTLRGRPVGGSDQINRDQIQPARIDRVGLLIADGQFGMFRLTLHEIGLWR